MLVGILNKKIPQSGYTGSMKHMRIVARISPCTRTPFSILLRKTRYSQCQCELILKYLRRSYRMHLPYVKTEKSMQMLSYFK